VNDDGTVDVSDVNRIIDYMGGGTPPAWPYLNPGIDSSPDDLPLVCGGGKSTSRDDDPMLKSGTTPTRFSLRQNSPNPFAEITEIRYDLPTSCHVRVEVYNSLGQRVATVVDANQQAGQQVVQWNASELSSGVYFCHIDADGFRETKKLVLMK
jgi:hypothetical protein